MLISKFDLYRGEWLELVFKNRNHQYGAYELRQTHNDVMTKTMTAMFITAALFGTVVTVIAHSKPPVAAREHQVIVEVPLDPKKVYEVQPKKEMVKPKTPKASPAQAPKTTPITMQEFKPMVAAPDMEAIDPKPLEANVAVGPKDVKVEGKNGDNAPVSGQGTNTDGQGQGEAPGNNEPVDVAFVQVMPEPIGGMDAWNKFLQKNLRYPALAQENGISGKSFMSFIIETDGSISNITVARKAGNGFDEEAARVLKLAKPWKPGKQNGQAVRVRYIIPINFQSAEQ